MSRTTFDVAVIGGGIIGMAVAYQVARRSALSVVVFEKGTGLGEGSTGSSSAITRQRYSTVENTRLARDANRVWHHWADYTALREPRGRNHPIGVLWMLGDDAVGVEADRARLVEESVDVAVLGPNDVRDRFPGLSTCAVPFDLTGSVPHECADGEAFLLERTAGYFDPTGALADVADAARAHGVDLRLGTRVTDLVTRAGSVCGVETSRGERIDAGLVVNAAGPWCLGVNRMAGLDWGWDIRPVRVQILHRPLPPEVPRPLPVVADAAGGIYFRPEVAGQQVVVGSVLAEDEQEEVEDPDRFDREATRTFLDTKVHALHHRLPSLPHRGTIGGMAGLYTMNHVDALPVVGPSGIDGYAVANGFSGHGFKESQMIGSLMAQWITGERASYDTDVPLSFFAVDRSPVATSKTVLA